MFASLAIVLAALAPVTLGREVIVERDGRAIFPRRFGQENIPIAQIASACGGGLCATLAGEAISTLLAGSPECAQQDQADKIIDASKTQDAATAAAMVAAAVNFRQAEKNTPPDFTTNPPTLRNSVFCQKAPKNPELIGLVQAQDPANDPDVFFDPALRASVARGSQANTAPFGGAAAPPPAEEPEVEAPPAEEPPVVEEPPAEEAPADCPAPVTVTVTAAPAPTAAPPAAEEPEVEAPPPAGGNNGGIFVFQGTLGGVDIPSVTDNGDGTFSVEGNATFNNLGNALVRACDVQNNQCANAANASGNREFTVGDCNAQQAVCIEQSRASVA